MLIQWFLSGTVRRAVELRQHVGRLLNEQRDLLAPEAVTQIDAASSELQSVIGSACSKKELEEAAAKFVTVADRWLKPYPSPGIRDNVKEFFVAATVILAFTTFFLQLTKIPTGSMQPTLFGITETDLRADPNAQFPGFLTRTYRYWSAGVSYYRLTAKTDGVVEEIEPAKLVLPFIKKQRVRFAGQWYTLWFPPDDLEKRAGLQRGQAFRAGEDFVRAEVVSGDHLLVDRLTYNFRRPERGEIIVFKTKGIRGLVQDQLYIKRMVAMPGERVRIGDDRHLRINDVRLDAATLRFENVYGFTASTGRWKYIGHVNQAVANRLTQAMLAPRFENGTAEVQVPDDQYLAMGDNTLNSLDSRAWGGLPESNIIGKCWFVYWPFTARFGWDNR